MKPFMILMTTKVDTDVNEESVHFCKAVLELNMLTRSLCKARIVKLSAIMFTMLV